MTQKQRGPDGPPESPKDGALKTLTRQAPDSTDILKDITGALEKSKLESKAKSAKRRILERCGCL